MLKAVGQRAEVLIEEFQRGDSHAFDVLVERWDRKIQGAIYRIMGPEEDARDLSQETLLKAYRALSTFKKEARFSSWLYQIALNVCRDRMRRRKSRPQVSLDELMEAGEISPAGRGPSPLDLIEARSEEHTSELQSRLHLVCRLLLEKKKSTNDS